MEINWFNSEKYFFTDESVKRQITDSISENFTDSDLESRNLCWNVIGNEPRNICTKNQHKQFLHWNRNYITEYETQITKKENCTISEEISETFEISKKRLEEKTPNI